MLNVGFTVGPNIGAAQPWGRSAGRSECGLIVHLPRWAGCTSRRGPAAGTISLS